MKPYQALPAYTERRQRKRDNKSYWLTVAILVAIGAVAAGAAVLYSILNSQISFK